jgi:hypothetical protein
MAVLQFMLRTECEGSGRIDVTQNMFRLRTLANSNKTLGSRRSQEFMERVSVNWQRPCSVQEIGTEKLPSGC